MKKILYFLLVLPLLAGGFISCDDDNDLPDVDLGISISNAKNIDGKIYLVAGDTLVVDSILITNNEKDKTALVTSATYYWNGLNLGTNYIYPYGFAIATKKYEANEDGQFTGTRPGDYLLAIETPVAAEGKSLAIAVQTYVVTVVESEEDIPSGTETPTAYTQPVFK